MTTNVGSNVPHPASTKHLFGLRQPGRLALAAFRLPLYLYHRGLGRLFGHTFLLFVHAGRKTGTPHEATAMVLNFDAATKEAVICSGWGPDADWVRNLRARPALRVQIGGDSFAPEQRFLTDDEAFVVGGRLPTSAPVEDPIHREGRRLGRPAIRHRASSVRERVAFRGLQASQLCTRSARIDDGSTSEPAKTGGHL